MAPHAEHIIRFGIEYEVFFFVFYSCCMGLIFRVALKDAELEKKNFRASYWMGALSVVIALSIPLYPLLAAHVR